MTMEELVTTLNKAAEAYYATDQELISNKEYDELYDQLQKMEEETGIHLPDSPVGKVGYRAVSELKQVEHTHPSLSLAKTKDRTELPAWLGTQSGILSWKMDGLTLVLTYNNGKLQTAVTRGNGYIGEDVTHNAPHIKGLPMNIPFSGTLIVRGEAVISYADFKNINMGMETPYKNPRNLASGSIRLLNSKETAARSLQFYAFELVETEKQPDTYEECFDLLVSYGFQIVDYKKVTADSVLTELAVFEDSIEHYDIPTDGLVLTYNDIPYGRSLGLTGRYPKNGIAFKWKDETVTTTLINVEWSASRTGLLNPVACFTPVEIEGTTVSRASVHNVRVLEDLNMGAGDEIEVYKANMIIPQIDKVSRKNSEKGFEVPVVCPVCGEKTERRINEDNTSEFLYCINPDCAAKKIGDFERLVCKDALNITGLSTQTLQVLMDHGYLHHRMDIFSLAQHKESLCSLEGFGQKSVENLLAAIEKSKKTTFRQFFYALGISGAGHDVSKILEKNLGYEEQKRTSALEELLMGTQAESVLSGMEGIGPKTAATIKNWWDNNTQFYKELLSLLDITDNVIQAQDDTQSLAGKTFVITGSLINYPNRNALKDEIERMGGKVAGSVSKNTSFLINNDASSSSNKNKKAKELNIPIISENDYISMFCN